MEQSTSTPARTGSVPGGPLPARAALVDVVQAQLLARARRLHWLVVLEHLPEVPSPVTRFFEGGRVSQTLDGVSKTLFDST